MRRPISSPATAVKAVYGGFIWIANSVKATVATYLVLMLIGGTLYSYFEHKSFGDSFWWAVVTASTVGYGDTYPTTTPGRIVAGFLISIMVLVVIPLITAHFASKLIVDNDAFRHEEQEEIKEHLRAIRASLESLARQEGLQQRPVRLEPEEHPTP